MALLGKFTKQPTEVLDYIIDYSEWFEGRSDVPESQVTTAEAGIAVVASTIVGNTVVVVLSGGTHNEKYKITTRLSTDATPTIVREADFEVAVKEE